MNCCDCGKEIKTLDSIDEGYIEWCDCEVKPSEAWVECEHE